MWINRKEQTPPTDGAYPVFGKINKGTEHENKCRFTAYWDNGLNAFTDKDGEDLTGIDEGVEFWLDFSDIPDPY